MSRLDEIFAYKRQEVAVRKHLMPLVQLEQAALAAHAPPDFVSRLKAPVAASGGQRGWYPMPVIAEIKRASPSRGLLAPGLDAVAMAGLYAANGAAAISVLTEEHFFLGSLDDLAAVARGPAGLPVLRKDFIFDPYQVYEARLAGAAALLLIAAALPPELLYDLHALTLSQGMAPLVEVHNRAELQTALACQPILLGINNRNLHDFSVDLQTSLELRQHAPADVCLVAESGIHTPADVRRLAEAGIDAILVGEALVTASDPAATLRSLVWYDQIKERS